MTKDKLSLSSCKVLLREATQDDARLIASLTRAAWSEGAPLNAGGHRETAVRVLEDLQDGGGFILYADGEPAGSVRWRPADCQPNVWEICRMGVIPEHRGRQLSLHLLEAVIHRAQESDVEELRLALPYEPARLLDLYAAHGFDFAPELEYTHGNPLEAAPALLRRRLRA